MMSPRALAVVVVAVALLGVLAAAPAHASVFATKLQTENSDTSTVLVDAFSAAYKIDAPDLTIINDHVVGSVGKALLFTHNTDLVLTPVTLTALEATLYPSIVQLPYAVAPVVPIYNVPAVSSGVTLQLSSLVLAKIFIGDITMWNDPLIHADNPGFVLPSANITVIVPSLSRPSIQSKVLTSTLGAIYPPFNAYVNSSSLVTWPLTRYAAYQVVSDVSNIQTSVLATPNSISYSSWFQAVSVGVNVPIITNSAGSWVSISATSVDIALQETSILRVQTVTGLTAVNNIVLELGNAGGANAWPMLATEYAVYDSSYSRSTCSTRLALVKLLLWIYQSGAASFIMTMYNVAPIPAIVVDQMDIITRIKTGIQCRGSSAMSAALVNGIVVSGDIRSNLVNDLLLNQFNINLGASSSSYNYQWTPNPSRLAVDQVFFSEVNLAMIFAENIDTEVWYQGVLNNEAYFNVPTFLFSIQLLFNTQITPILDLGANATLTLAMDVIAAIFTGQISDWGHASILATNPELAAALAASPQPAPINLLYACDTLQQDTMGSYLLRVLAHHYPALQSYVDTMDTTAVNLCTQSIFISNSNVNNNVSLTLVNAEVMIGPAVRTLPGGFGYQQYGSVVTTGLGTINVLHDDTVRTPSPDSMLACVSDTLDPQTLSLPVWFSDNGDCYPFTQTMYAVMQNSYTAAVSGPGSCISGALAINYLTSLYNQSSNDQTLRLAGSVRVAEHENVRAIIDAALQRQQCVCDGVSMLNQPPVSYVVNPSLTAFSRAMAIIGIAASVIALTVLIVHRRQPVVHTAKLPLLVVSTVGLCMLFASLIPLVAPATTASCSALMWTVNVGYTLLFLPICLKALRIYGVHGGGSLVAKVHRMSSQSMNAAMVALIALDWCVLATWQGVSPWTPVITSQMEGNPPVEHLYGQCGQPSDGRPFLISVGIVKAAALVLGALISFTVRRVMTTYNEQRHSALTLYNTIIATGLCIPLALVSSIIGDGLSVLLIICVLWISVVAWSALFIPKLISIANPKSNSEMMQQAMSATDAVKSVSLGFSFHNIALMGEEILHAYIQALEGQVKDIKEKMADSGISPQQPESSIVQTSTRNPSEVTIHRRKTVADESSNGSRRIGNRKSSMQ